MLPLSHRAASAQLPTGVTLVPFYDTAQVSFARDSVRTVAMAEVPGKSGHFLVLDQMGAVYTLYPDTSLAYADGAIKKYSKGRLLDIRSQVKHNLRSEMGAWALAFSPRFADTRAFYLLYYAYNATASDAIRSDGYVTLDRWILAADYKHAKRDTTVFRFYHGPSYGVSSMAFGPDGYLYMGTSVYSENGWDTTGLGRKILRLDVEHPDGKNLYSIPADNPFVKSPAPGARKEIWAWGFRNVWTMAFDFGTGNLWAGDVGQELFEEIDLVKPGKNYGWADGGNGEPSANGFGVQGKCVPGFSAKGKTCSDLADPEWVFSHTTAPAINCIVVGPAFRGDPASPFYGYHFVTDVQRGEFWALKEGSTPQKVGQVPLSISPNKNAHNGIVNLTEDGHGNLYAVMVSWHFDGDIGGSVNPLPAGESMYHEIYRLSHPSLTPSPSPLGIKGPGLPAGPRERVLLRPGRDGWLEVPGGFGGAGGYDLKGKCLWTTRGTGRVRVPQGMNGKLAVVRFTR